MSFRDRFLDRLGEVLSRSAADAEWQLANLGRGERMWLLASGFLALREILEGKGSSTARPTTSDTSGNTCESGGPSERWSVPSEVIEDAARAVHVERYGEDLWDTPRMSAEAKDHYRAEATVAIRVFMAHCGMLEPDAMLASSGDIDQASR